MFHPHSSCELCSVGVDRQVMLWDTRAGTAPRAVVENVHSGDVNCVDWSALDANYLVTGSNDRSVCIVDLRKQEVTTRLSGHLSPVNSVQFCPFSHEYVASCADSLNLWRLNDESERAELVMKHCGHQGPVVDFGWNQENEFTFLSSSDDSELRADEKSDGSLQIFRPLDLLLCDYETALHRLAQHI